MGLFKRKSQNYDGYKKQYSMYELQPIKYVGGIEWMMSSRKKNPNMRLAGSDNVPTKRQRDIVKRQNESVKLIQPKPQLFDWEKEI